MQVNEEESSQVANLPHLKTALLSFTGAESLDLIPSLPIRFEADLTSPTFLFPSLSLRLQKRPDRS